MQAPSLAADPRWIGVVAAFIRYSLSPGYSRGATMAWQSAFNIPNAAQIWARRLLLGFTDAQLLQLSCRRLWTTQALLDLMTPLLPGDTRAGVYYKTLESAVSFLLDLAYFGSTLAFFGFDERAAHHLKSLSQAYHAFLAKNSSGPTSSGTAGFNERILNNPAAYGYPTSKPVFHILWALPYSYTGLFDTLQNIRSVTACLYLVKGAEAFAAAYFRTLIRCPSPAQYHLSPSSASLSPPPAFGVVAPLAEPCE